MEISTREALSAAQAEAKVKVGRRVDNRRLVKDTLARRGLFVAAILLIVLLFFIGGLLLIRSLPILQDHSLVQLLTSVKWRPTHGEFGLAPFIAGSFAVTLVAMALAVVITVLLGREIAGKHRRLRRLGVALPASRVAGAVLREHAASLYGLSANAVRYYGVPLLAMSALWRPLLPAIAVLMLVAPVVDHRRLKPACGLAPFVGLYWLEMAAYQVGVWRGCLGRRHRLLEGVGSDDNLHQGHLSVRTQRTTGGRPAPAYRLNPDVESVAVTASELSATRRPRPRQRGMESPPGASKESSTSRNQ